MGPAAWPLLGRPAPAGWPLGCMTASAEVIMLIALAVLLAIAWVLGFTVMKVSSVAIHLLILFAVVALIGHFFRRGASTA
jgi:hypothetical protein